MTTSFETILNAELATEAKAAKKSVNKLSKKAAARAFDRATEIHANMVNEKLVNEPETVLEEASVPRETKRSVCADVFRSMIGARRKNVIKSMMDHANLSKNGAATYYQNFFSGKWEV